MLFCMEIYILVGSSYNAGSGYELILVRLGTKLGPSIYATRFTVEMKLWLSYSAGPGFALKSNFSFRRPNYWDLKVQVLPTLLAFGADPEKYIKDRETGFPLIDAARSGSLKAVKLLQSKGARVNLYLARYCGTALQAAASRGHLEVAEYLVQHGADINVPCVQQIQLPGYYNYEVLISILTPVQIAAMVDNVSFLR